MEQLRAYFLLLKQLSDLPEEADLLPVVKKLEGAIMKGLSLDNFDLDRANQRLHLDNLSEADAERLRQYAIKAAVNTLMEDEPIFPEGEKLVWKLAGAFELDADFTESLLINWQQHWVEKNQNKAIFTNMLVVALADGELNRHETSFLEEVAENLNLTSKDITGLLMDSENLQFEIPADETERYYSLRNLVYVMIVDGEVSAEEYARCLEFANRCGYDPDVVDDIIDEYARLRQEKLNEQAEIDRVNTDICLDVIESAQNCTDTPELLIQKISDFLLNGGNGPEGQDPLFSQRPVLELLWLCLQRLTEIHPDGPVDVADILLRAKEAGSMAPIREYLLQTEAQYGISEITLPEMSETAILADIKARLN